MKIISNEIEEVLLFSDLLYLYNVYTIDYVMYFCYDIIMLILITIKAISMQILSSWQIRYPVKSSCWVLLFKDNFKLFINIFETLRIIIESFQRWNSVIISNSLTQKANHICLILLQFLCVIQVLEGNEEYSYIICYCNNCDWFGKMFT